MRYLKNIAGKEISLSLNYKGSKLNFKIPDNAILPVSDLNFDRISKLKSFNRLIAEIKD